MKGIFVGMAGAAAACLQAVKEAVKKASAPGALSFGICIMENAEPGPFFQAAAPAGCRVEIREGISPAQAWQTVYGLYGGQPNALQISPEAVFCQGWDRRLKEALRLAKAPQPLLTAFLSPDGIMRAASAGFVGEGKLRIGPGVKVIHALHPPKGLFLSPDFIFGAGAWMLSAREKNWDGASPLAASMHAFACGFEPFIPHVPVFGRRTSAAFAPEGKPQGDLSALLADFEAESGISFEKREVGGRGRLGLYTPDGRYPVQLPLEEGIKQYLRRHKEGEGAKVMLATALGAPSGKAEQEVSQTLLQNLAALKRLPVCCYCPPNQARRLQQVLPNTYARPAEEGLSYDSEAEFLRAKPYFIAQAALQFPGRSHYGWIDAGYLKHPVYPDAVFLWNALADEKIHLAQVQGKVDAGLVIVPRTKVEWLLKTASVLNPSPGMGAGDTGLFQCLADTYPEEFILHAMEKRHMLLSLCQPLISGGMLCDA